jgi:serine/threonine protein kinase
VSFLIPQGPLYNISKEFPVKLPEEESCYGRVFKFQQYPIDLFQRVVVSTLNFPDVSAVRISDSGLLVSHRDCVRVNLQYLKNSYKILVELRFSTKNTSVEKIALAFWRQILENLRTQLECFCAGLSWNELIPCIHCIRRGVSRDKVYLMKYQEVIDRADQPFLYCHQIESFSRCIARTEVAPDISLCDLPQVSMKHLQIGEQIGEGGFGVVYKGSLNNGNQSIVVAVKELSAAGSEGFLDGDLFREFQIEAYIQSLLDHPNCVKLYGLTATPPRMILEFINGGDLCKLLHKSKDQGFTQETFPWAKRYQIAFDIVKGLHHMQSHDPPIIHRDIRSPNIFMSKDGRALIGDFGLARLVNPEVGGLLGTWQWLAPECIDSLETGSYDHRSDIYSFGMVLWEISSFAVPFEEFQDDLRYMQNGKLKLQELKRAIIDEHLRPTIPSTTPESIKGLIRRCWDANRDVRPSTREILEILASEMGCSDQVVAEINKPPPSPMDSRLSSHLVTFTPPTIRPECPFAAETFSASGKF